MIKRRQQKAPEPSLRGCQFQPIGMRSEVTGDAEPARETIADPLPGARRQELVRLTQILNGSNKPAGR